VSRATLLLATSEEKGEFLAWLLDWNVEFALDLMNDPGGIRADSSQGSRGIGSLVRQSHEE
jgi:hypothetical protein